ncbi:YkgJ family cysteine cluster protein [Methanoculleus sp.]|jgi:Fe-S-cluster containining protein|uniref:YkgJ family cysteine cluster protein n=1 Tax=Methanoculleus sp. TaxID=90427 RepID=UPI0025FA6F93|nr:YkgJ family cysteine cluster protein [Methanoculleus sp.]MCK9320015.1 YkgJ family cysteine cluster protein [Methanoculleus sp.]MDD2260245.1 YkgJ family cysteine cluster protein [Acholeplasmataceae bacterium]
MEKSDMACSMCGACCKYLVFTITQPIDKVKTLINQPIMMFAVDKTFSEDEKRYFSYREVQILEDKGKTLVFVKNEFPEQNHAEYISRNNYKVVIYSPCNKLENNLCSIWDTKPDVCDYTKSTLEIWKPKCCTD